MKLVYCEKCEDIFKLVTGEVRSCACGRCKGRYDPDGGHAVTNGNGHALAIGNMQLYRAIARFQVDRGQVRSKPYAMENFTFHAWVRAHSGSTNPRSRIEEELQ